jgi:hypothetical protein
MLHHSLPSKRVHLPSYTIETRETQKRLEPISKLPTAVDPI